MIGAPGTEPFYTAPAIRPNFDRLSRKRRRPALRAANSIEVGNLVCVEHGHRAPVLRPAGDVVADCHRTLLAVGDGAHAVCRDSLRDHEVAHRIGATGTESEVVLARAALVGVALDRE